MIRLVATDLDSTLLPEGTFDLNPEYFEVVRKLSEKGILFTVASGRHYSSLRRMWGSVEDETVFLCGNGSAVMWHGEVLDKNEIDPELYRAALEAMMAEKPELIITDIPECIVTDRKENRILTMLREGYRDDIKYVPDVFSPGGPMLKIAMYVDGDSKPYADRLQKKFEGRLNIMAAGAHWVDVVAKGTDKGTMLAGIQKRFGIPREETIAFGDNGNDIGMLREAGYSYAVANARPEVKAAAHEVIGPMEDDAVLKVLYRLLQADAGTIGFK